MALPDTTGNLGPGLLTIGMTGTPIDISCLVNNCKIAAEKDEGDSTTKLCGDTRAGAVTYSYKMTGNTDTDIKDPDGFFALSWASPGAVLDFVFTPDNAATTSASGQLIVNPLDFGADEAGADLTSDFEFTLNAKPTFTYPVVGGLADDEPVGVAA
jgi:hypothetical protein